SCELFAQVVSLQHHSAERLEEKSLALELEAVHDRLLQNAERADTLAPLATVAPTLLEAVSADGAALHAEGRWWCMGRTPPEPELDALAGWVLERPELRSSLRPAYATDSLSRSYPPAAGFAGSAAALLAVPLSWSDRSLMLWFRQETIRSVNWGGDPGDK